jgi:RNase P subunit RPR2
MLTMNKQYKAIADFLFADPVPTLQVYSNSMQPLLAAGQQIKILPLRKPLTCGKCYIFIYKGKLLIHRLMKVINDTAVFIADSAQKKEEVPIDAVIAEPALKQRRMIISVIGLLNQVSYTLIKVFPGFAKVRIKIVRGIFKCERALYERKL